MAGNQSDLLVEYEHIPFKASPDPSKSQNRYQLIDILPSGFLVIPDEYDGELPPALYADILYFDGDEYTVENGVVCKAPQIKQSS